MAVNEQVSYSSPRFHSKDFLEELRLFLYFNNVFAFNRLLILITSDRPFLKQLAQLIRIILQIAYMVYTAAYIVIFALASLARYVYKQFIAIATQKAADTNLLFTLSALGNLFSDILHEIRYMTPKQASLQLNFHLTDNFIEILDPNDISKLIAFMDITDRNFATIAKALPDYKLEEYGSFYQLLDRFINGTNVESIKISPEEFNNDLKKLVAIIEKSFELSDNDEKKELLIFVNRLLAHVIENKEGGTSSLESSKQNALKLFRSLQDVFSVIKNDGLGISLLRGITKDVIEPIASDKQLKIMIVNLVHNIFGDPGNRDSLKNQERFESSLKFIQSKSGSFFNESLLVLKKLVLSAEHEPSSISIAIDAETSLTESKNQQQLVFINHLLDEVFENFAAEGIKAILDDLAQGDTIALIDHLLNPVLKPNANFSALQFLTSNADQAGLFLSRVLIFVAGRSDINEKELQKLLTVLLSSDSKDLLALILQDVVDLASLERRKNVNLEEFIDKLQSLFGTDKIKSLGDESTQALSEVIAEFIKPLLSVIGLSDLLLESSFLADHITRLLALNAIKEESSPLPLLKLMKSVISEDKEKSVKSALSELERALIISNPNYKDKVRPTLLSILSTTDFQSQADVEFLGKIEPAFVEFLVEQKDGLTVVSNIVDLIFGDPNKRDQDSSSQNGGTLNQKQKEFIFKLFVEIFNNLSAEGVVLIFKDLASRNVFDLIDHLLNPLLKDGGEFKAVEFLRDNSDQAGLFLSRILMFVSTDRSIKEEDLHKVLSTLLSVDSNNIVKSILSDVSKLGTAEGIKSLDRMDFLGKIRELMSCDEFKILDASHSAALSQIIANFLMPSIPSLDTTHQTSLQPFFVKFVAQFITSRSDDDQPIEMPLLKALDLAAKLYHADVEAKTLSQYVSIEELDTVKEDIKLLKNLVKPDAAMTIALKSQLSETFAELVFPEEEFTQIQTLRDLLLKLNELKTRAEAIDPSDSIAVFEDDSIDILDDIKVQEVLVQSTLLLLEAKQSAKVDLSSLLSEKLLSEASNINPDLIIDVIANVNFNDLSKNGDIAREKLIALFDELSKHHLDSKEIKDLLKPILKAYLGFTGKEVERGAATGFIASMLNYFDPSINFEHFIDGVIDSITFADLAVLFKDQRANAFFKLNEHSLEVLHPLVRLFKESDTNFAKSISSQLLLNWVPTRLIYWTAQSTHYAASTAWYASATLSKASYSVFEYGLERLGYQSTKIDATIAPIAHKFPERVSDAPKIARRDKEISIKVVEIERKLNQLAKGLPAIDSLIPLQLPTSGEKPELKI